MLLARQAHLYVCILSGLVLLVVALKAVSVYCSEGGKTRRASTILIWSILLHPQAGVRLPVYYNETELKGPCNKSQAQSLSYKHKIWQLFTQISKMRLSIVGRRNATSRQYCQGNVTRAMIFCNCDYCRSMKILSSASSF